MDKNDLPASKRVKVQQIAILVQISHVVINVFFITEYLLIRIAADRWTCAQSLSQAVLNESVPPVSRWSSSGIAVLRIADRCLHYPQPRIV
ncbi:hypothetical protein AYI69_g1931 [Smittium culicis]|uniref:Uncharacterized protein n=1 Tax=Smittium culicis TaxID=133412 RepID=A0A1R1YNV5_9FUNG|nr:hypothetical protein AYI69_g1931 [Smittium culicis]